VVTFSRRNVQRAMSTAALAWLGALACSGRSRESDRYVVVSGGTAGASGTAGANGLGGRSGGDTGEGTSAGDGGFALPAGAAGHVAASAGEGASSDAGAGNGLGGGGTAGSSNAGGGNGATAPVAGDVLYVKASNPDNEDAFGTTLALTDDWLAVGAPDESSRATGIDGDQSDDSEDYSGAVYLFGHSPQGWAQSAYVKASNTGAGDGFGKALALDGDTLAVSAPFEDSAARGIDGDELDESGGNSGAVYIFRASGGSWQKEAYLKASNSDPIDLFGTGLALSGDTLVVGAPWEDGATTGSEALPGDNAADRSGAAYVFTRVASGWTEQGYLKAPDATELGEFGTSVALSGDRLAVGAPGAGAANEAADDRGAVYLFERSGQTYVETDLVRSDRLTPGDRFGAPVALAGDVLAVSAVEDAMPSTTETANREALRGSGAVYVFSRNGAAWGESAYLKAPTPQKDAFFGFALALFGDTLYVGAIGEDRTTRPYAGVVYVYVNAAGGWALRDRIVAPNQEANDRFGSALGLSPAHLAIGVYNEDGASPGIDGDRSNNDAPGSGAVFLYER
jgi:hypothetical protein